MILSSDDIAKLYELGGFSSSERFRLIYRATRDGFGASEFHAKTDNYANTLTVAVTGAGYVFAGFTRQLWNVCNCWRNDSAAFLLSLRRNVAGFNVKTDAIRFGIIQPEKAIFAGNGYGPTFGDGHDIFVCDYSNVATSISHSWPGVSYALPSGYSAATQPASSLLVGCDSFDGARCLFTNTEIEVFALI